MVFLMLCSLAFMALASDITRARSLSKKGRAQEISFEEIFAAEKRLSDLGFWTGPVDGTLDSGSRHALIAFQKVEGRQRTGKLTRAEFRPSVSSKDHMTHTVSGVKRLELETADDRDAALEIEDGKGGVTIVYFESESPAS